MNLIEHHFTILDSCGLKPRSYLVRYGLALPYAIPSPSCQLVWHTAYQIKSKLKISFGTVDAAIRAFDNPRAYKTTPTPSLTFTPSPSVSTRPKKKKERSLHNGELGRSYSQTHPHRLTDYLRPSPPCCTRKTEKQTKT